MTWDNLRNSNAQDWVTHLNREPDKDPKIDTYKPIDTISNKVENNKKD